MVFIKTIIVGRVTGVEHLETINQIKWLQAADKKNTLYTVKCFPMLAVSSNSVTDRDQGKKDWREKGEDERAGRL